ncbi:MAG: MmgE/PrpD family protein [Dehalococcoidia bacterium]|nr:MmgE/PrpD family protein [Dehalococcoidia bacterium]
MTVAEKLASFAVRASYEDISEEARLQLKIRILDALGCAIGALGGEPVAMVKAQIEEFGGNALCTLIGGGSTSPDRAALYNSALVRYLDFNDSYLAKGETCHPSDNLGAVLAAAEYAKASGKDLLAALAVAYQVQCRLSDVAPVRFRGFDHTSQGSFAVAAGVARALGLDAVRTANAIAISGTAFNALRVTRTGSLSHWKGLAYPNTAFGCVHAAFLARRGVTGPLEVFEGNKGFMEAVSGPFELDWDLEDLERVKNTILKRHNAEIHSQSAVEGMLELRERYDLNPADVRRVEIEIFDVAFNIIGGGEEGAKTAVRTKEEADHSLPYIVSVALLDGRVMPEQYLPERIQRSDVQALLRKVTVTADESFSRRFPFEMPCRVRVWLQDGQDLSVEKDGYEGFLTKPMRWDTVVRKFEQLSRGRAMPPLFGDITDAVSRLEGIRVEDLTRLLARVQP